MNVQIILQTKYSINQITAYFVLTFLITWTFLIPAITTVPTNIQTLFFISAAFGPMIAAIALIWVTKGKKDAIQWIKNIFQAKTSKRNYLSGILLLPIGIGLLQCTLYSLLGGTSAFTSAVPWKYYPIYLVLTLLTGGNEEPGWRGFALPALLGHFHPLIATIILGLIHSAWHYPLLNHYGTTFGWYVLNLVPLTVLFNWLYLRSNRSVWPVMFFHSSTNIISSFIPTPDLVLGGFGGFMVLRSIVYWVIALVIIALTRGSLGYNAHKGIKHSNR